MSRQDWLTAGVVAVFVALLTVAVTAPPMCWAGPDTPVGVPALSSANLSLPTLHAQVSASAIPAPGQAVEVTLAITPSAPTATPSGSMPASMTAVPAKPTAFSLPVPFSAVSLQRVFGASGVFRVLFARVTPAKYHVPVTVTILRTDMNVMSRSMPEPEQVTRIETSVPVGPGGTGSVVLPLPLTWAQPEKPQVITPNVRNPRPVLIMRRIVSYQMVLSSPLGGKAAPSELRRVARMEASIVMDRRL